MFTFCAIAIEKYKNCTMLTDNAVIQEQISHFVDASTVSDWSRSYVATCIKYGLITGTPVGDGRAINPTNAITRAEVAVALERTIKLKDLSPYN